MIDDNFNVFDVNFVVDDNMKQSSVVSACNSGESALTCSTKLQYDNNDVDANAKV